jgi:hypothetical protein
MSARRLLSGKLDIGADMAVGPLLTRLGHWPTVPAAIRCGSVFGMTSGGSDEPQPRLTGTWWRTGNARMKTPVTRRQALAATSALALAFAAKAGDLEKVGMQLILAADVSGSVNSARYKTQQDGYLEALGDSRVLNVIAELEPPVLAIAFIAWAREQAVMVPWMRVQDAKSMELFRNRLKQTQRPQIGINTLISKALLFCDARFDQEFTGGRKVIDVSGDGDDNQGIAALHDVRDALIGKGVVINGLPIIVKPPEYIFPQQPSEGLDVYYRNHVVGGEGHVLIESIGFDNFKQAILQKLLLEIG